MSDSLRHPSFWESDASLPLTTPNTNPTPLPAACDFLIVGAGFAGRWLAWFLTKHFQRSIQRGELRHAPSICLLERDAFSYGASSRNAGFLTSGHLSEMLADIRDHSMDAVRASFLQRVAGVELAHEELGDHADSLGIARTGSIDWDEPSGEAHELAETLNVSLREREMPPLFSLRLVRSAKGEVRRYFNAQDGTIQPVRAMQALELGASERGASFHFGVEVKQARDGLARIKVSDQERELRYEHAFICTNAFASQLDQSSNIQPGRGQVLLTEPLALPWNDALGYLNQGYDYFRSIKGRLLIGGGRHRFRELESSDQLEPSDALRTYLHDLACELLARDSIQIEQHWAGIMGFPGGTHAVGVREKQLDAKTSLLAGFGGMGVALTPIAAKELVARFTNAG